MRYGVILAAAGLAAWAAPVMAQQYVEGYTRSDGTYVQGHYRSSPNDTRLDNYSTRGNTNPFTGERGTRDPFPDSSLGGNSFSPPEPTYNDDYSDGIDW